MTFVFEIGYAGGKDWCHFTKKKMAEGTIKLGTASSGEDSIIQPTMMWRTFDQAEKFHLASLKKDHGGFEAIKGWDSLTADDKIKAEKAFEGILAGIKKKAAAKRKSTDGKKTSPPKKAKSTETKEKKEKAPKEKKEKAEKEPKEKKKKDPNAPKNGRNAYLLYTTAVRASVTEANPEAKMTDLTKIMGTQWKELGADEKKKYEDMAAEDKARHQRQLKEFEETGTYTKTEEEVEKDKADTAKKAAEKEKRTAKAAEKAAEKKASAEKKENEDKEAQKEEESEAEESEKSSSESEDSGKEDEKMEDKEEAPADEEEDKENQPVDENAEDAEEAE